MKTIEEKAEELIEHLLSYSTANEGLRHDPLKRGYIYVGFATGHAEGYQKAMEGNEALLCEIDNLHNLIVWEHFKHNILWHSILK